MENKRPLNQGLILLCLCAVTIISTGINASDQIEAVKTETASQPYYETLPVINKKAETQPAENKTQIHIPEQTHTAEPASASEPEYLPEQTYSPSSYEMDMLCAIVISEAGNCDDNTQKAIAHTVLNRTQSDKFPDTIQDVVMQPDQYDAINTYLDYDYPENLEPGTDGWYHTMELCYDTLTEPDFTNGAVFYYNPTYCGNIDWFESMQLTYTDAYGSRFFTTD